MNAALPSPTHPSLDGADAGLSLREFIATVLDSWHYALGIIAFCTAFGLYRVWVTVPLYETTALVELQNKSASMGMSFEQENPYAFMGQAQSIAGQLEILKSRSMMAKVAADLDITLVVTPNYYNDLAQAVARRRRNGPLAEPPFYIPGGKRYAWGGEVIDIAGFTIPPGYNGKPFVLIALEPGHYAISLAGTRLLEGKVGETVTQVLAPDETLSVLVAKLVARPDTEFRIFRDDPIAVSQRLQTLVRVRERAGPNAYTGTGLLELTAKTADPQEAADIANSLANTYLRSNVEQISEEAEAKLKFLDVQLPRLRDALQGAEGSLLEMKTKAGPYRFSDSSKSILESLTALERQISDLELQRAELSQTVTSQHPAMQALVRKIERLQADRAKINAQLVGLPDAEVKLLQVTRDADVARAMYLTLLNKAQELRLAKAGTIGNVRIVDTAIPPKFSTEPDRRKILTTWILIGILGAIAAAYLRTHLNVKLVTPEDAERRTGLTVFATIPFSKHQSLLARKLRPGDAGDILLSSLDPKDPAVESLRSLRASLHFTLLEAKSRILAITGVTPKVGKTFVAANLANLVVDAGQTVLLIDADLRKGRLHGVFGWDRGPGLSEILAGEVTPEQAVRRGPKAGFDILTTGRLPPNPAELVASERFEQLVRKLATQYTLVILDTPPVMNLADPIFLCKVAGAVMVTVRGRLSSVHDVQDGVKRLTQAGIKVDGLIFNAFKAGVGSYVHPKYYQYRYRYSHYGEKNK